MGGEADFDGESVSPSTLSLEWRAYKALVNELIRLRLELAQLTTAEKTQRITVYESSNETSIRGREREADAPTLNLTVDIINLKAEIAGKEDMRDFLVLAINHGVSVL